MDELLKWAPLAITALNLGAGFFLWSVARTLVSKQELVEVSNRLAALEHDFQNIPKWDALHELRGQLAETSGNLKVANARIEGLNELLKRVERSMGLVQEQLLGKSA